MFFPTKRANSMGDRTHLTIGAALSLASAATRFRKAAEVAWLVDYYQTLFVGHYTYVY